jgi:hypothetical protein
LIGFRPKWKIGSDIKNRISFATIESDMPYDHGGSHSMDLKMPSRAARPWLKTTHGPNAINVSQALKPAAEVATGPRCRTLGGPLNHVTPPPLTGLRPDAEFGPRETSRCS